MLDCRDVGGLGITIEDLLNDVDVDIPQRLALAAIAKGAKGLLVPSATLLGDKLVLFVDRRRSDSLVQELDHVEPRLTKLGPMGIRRSPPGRSGTE